MRYKLLGKSGLRVSEICLGAMTFGLEWGWGADKKESRKIFNAFAEKGGNFIDTANKYTEGTSEKYVGEFVKPNRNRYVVATKYTLTMDPTDPNASGNHRKNMIQSVEASLKRLKTDYIDLYWLHMWDFSTPVEEVMRGLDDLVRSGKVAYIGISDTPAWIVSRANMMAELRGWSQFIGLQLKYNLFDRSIEREFIPMARELDIGITAWSTLQWGLLSGKYSVRKGKLVSRDKSRRIPQDAVSNLTPERLSIISEVEKAADECGKSVAQTAIRWVMEKGAIPIVGATSKAQILDNLACSDFSLSDELVERLDKASAIELGFPHDFIAKEGVRERIYGNFFGRLDNHRQKNR